MSILVDRVLLRALLSALFCVGGMMGAQAQVTPATVTLEQFRERLQTHPELARQRLNPQLQRAVRDSLGGSRDVTLRGTADVMNSDEAAVGAGGAGLSRQRRAMLGLNHRVWATGTEFDVSSGAARQRYFGGDPIYASDITVAVRQPLLQDFRSALTKLGYDLAEFDVALAVIERARAEEAFIQNHINMYWQWALAYKLSSIFERRVKLATEELAVVKKRRQANLVDEVDVLRAQGALQDAQQDYTAQYTQYVSLGRYLAEQMKWDDLRTAIPQNVEAKAPQQVPELAQNWIDLSQDMQLLATQAKKWAYEKKAMRPHQDVRLDVVGSSTWRDDGDRLSQARNESQSNHRIGLEMSVPLGRIENKAMRKRSQLSYDIVQAQAKVTARALAAQMAQLVASFEGQVKLLNQQQSRLTTQRKQSDAEFKLYQQSRTELTFVLQSRNRESLLAANAAQTALRLHELYWQIKALADQVIPAKEAP